MNETKTTIAILPTTKERLRDVGKMGQTDDDLINQLVDFWLRYAGVVERELLG